MTGDPAVGKCPDFVCPINGNLMRDPVIVADGNSYERTEIERWLEPPLQRLTSPITNIPLAHFHLTPNLTLRKAIEFAVEQEQRAIEEYTARSKRQRTG